MISPQNGLRREDKKAYNPSCYAYEKSYRKGIMKLRWYIDNV
jgi:hypothetical protein